MKSTVPRWISWTPTATSSAPGTSSRQSASPCGSSHSRASQIAAKANSATMLMSSPPRPSSARALPAPAITAAKAAIAASMTSAAGSGRRTRPTRPSHARLWTARIARAAEFADHSSATTAKTTTDQRVPDDSFADSPIGVEQRRPEPDRLARLLPRVRVDGRRVAQDHGEQQRERQQRAEQPERERAGEQPAAVALVVAERAERVLDSRAPAVRSPRRARGARTSAAQP